eukprot:GHVT01097040.1.p1 GENE.GHVT01097040.1~~GHVT01097040.1.p1  ORF type:complete len:321 (+),score=2.77 GHVT01097040.1:2258-3220(+)
MHMVYAMGSHSCVFIWLHVENSVLPCLLRFPSPPDICRIAGFIQANLVILPREYAFEFLRFCLVNPRPAPLLEVTSPGNYVPSLTAPSADLRTDLPKYRVFSDGQLVEETDVKSYWRDDLVSFLLGCSFSWDEELVQLSLPPPHITQGRNVPMYKTNIPLNASPPFQGCCVVSLRIYPREAVETVRQITEQYPGAHGGPIHIGDPQLIGINASPQRNTCGKIIGWKFPPADFGDSPIVPFLDAAVADKTGSDSELSLIADATVVSELVPMFWACGVTPHVALQTAKIPFYITHSPGHMFVTDLHITDVTQHKVYPESTFT